MDQEHAPPPQQWPNVNVPPGYRFKPTPRELIQCYLEPWVGITEPGHQSMGEFYGIMAAADVYGEDPGALASRFHHIAHDDGNWYFLSVARWKDGNAGGSGSGSANNNKQRMNRTVDRELGTWHGSGKRIPVRGVGYRQSFEFRPAGGGKTVWLMEEFGTARADATGKDGVRVLCRLHLRPKAAAAAAAADGADDRQQLEANDDVPPAPSNKRQRQRAPAHYLDADYWTAAAPDVGFSSSSYATTAAAAPPPPPPDVGCSSSYATTSSQAAAAAAAAPATELTAEASATTWQHQPMMEQAGDGGYQYHCADAGGGVRGGGVYIRAADDEPQPLEEMVTADGMEFTAQDLKPEDYDFAFAVESLLQEDDGWIMDSNGDGAFSFLQQLKCDGVQENDDPKPELISDGVQENDDGDPKGADIAAS